MSRRMGLASRSRVQPPGSQQVPACPLPVSRTSSGTAFPDSSQFLLRACEETGLKTQSCQEPASLQACQEPASLQACQEPGSKPQSCQGPVCRSGLWLQEFLPPAILQVCPPAIQSRVSPGRQPELAPLQGAQLQRPALLPFLFPALAWRGLSGSLMQPLVRGHLQAHPWSMSPSTPRCFPTAHPTTHPLRSAFHRTLPQQEGALRAEPSTAQPPHVLMLILSALDCPLA